MIATMQPQVLESMLEASFLEIYDRHSATVLRYLRIAVGEADAEDLCSDCFCSAWTAWARYKGDRAEALPWLMRIARNRVIDRSRRRKRLADSIGHFMVVGWDQQGPLAGTAVPIGTQNLGPECWSSPLYHLDMSGNTTDRVGGSDCTVALVAEGGAVLCEGSAFEGRAAQVRTGSGGTLYSLASDAVSHYSAAISPTGDRVAFASFPSPTPPNHIYGRGYSALIPGDFYSVGWEDDQTLVGTWETSTIQRSQ